MSARRVEEAEAIVRLRDGSASAVVADLTRPPQSTGDTVLVAGVEEIGARCSAIPPPSRLKKIRSALADRDEGR